MFIRAFPKAKGLMFSSDGEETGDTPIQLAAREGHAEAVQLLLPFANPGQRQRALEAARAAEYPQVRDQVWVW